MTTHRLQGIRASAGSGKTYQLTQRYLELLANGAEPESILATTFTRKAAGEILGRVLGELARRARDGHPGARADLLRMSRSLHRVTICTLDSLFHRMASGFRHELGLPPGATPVDRLDSRAQAMSDEAVRRLLEMAVGTHQRRDLMNLLLDFYRQGAHRSVAGGLVRSLAELHDLYQDAPESAWVLRPIGTDLTEDELACIPQHFDFDRWNLPNKLREAVLTVLDDWNRAEWDRLLGRTLIQRMADPQPVFDRRPVAPQDLVKSLRIVRDYALWAATRDASARLAAAHKLLQRYDREFARLRREQRLLLFEDIPRALGALREQDPALLDYRLDQRYEHLLLDEFQDTSPSQWRILQPLVDRIVREEPRGGTLFCVGDVKQAIYGWRGATAEIFDQLGQAVPGLEWTHLDRSWRSSSVVLEAVNRVFGAVGEGSALSPEVRQVWARGFHPHQAEKELPGYVEVRAAEREPAEGEDEPDGRRPRLMEAARWVAEIAAAAPGRSLGVLLRTNAAARLMLFELRELGMDASGEGGGTLCDDPVVETLLAALTLADHPGNQAAYFQVAQSPLAVILQGATETAQIEAWSAAVRRALLSRGYAALLAQWARVVAPHCDRRSAERLAQLITLAENPPGEAMLRPSRLVEYVRSRRVEEPVPAAIRVMTIHGAKGLEFDAVLLPELDRAYDLQARSFLADREGDSIRAVYPYPSSGLREAHPGMRDAWNAYATRQRLESLCLLYVAMTRAIHGLYMLVPPDDLRRECDASLLRQALYPEVPPEPGVLYRAGDAGWARSVEAGLTHRAAEAWIQSVRLAPATGTPRRALRRIRPSEEAFGARVRGDFALRLADREDLDYGTLIHAWFAAVEWDGAPVPDDGALLAIGRRSLPRRDEAWIRSFLPEWRATLSDPVVREVLSSQAGPGIRLECRREYRFQVVLDDDLVSGTIDRAVIHSLGEQPIRARLVDFKTDPGAPEELLQTYGPQLQLYRRALARLLHLDDERVEASMLLIPRGKPARWVPCNQPSGPEVAASLLAPAVASLPLPPPGDP